MKQYSEIQLRGRLKKKTKVDTHLLPEINKHNWGYSGHGYAYTKIPATRAGKKIYLHRYLLKAPKNKEVDHINGDTLDNRIFNLRLVTRSQNNMNRPGTKGVWFSKQKNKYVVEIKKDRTKKHHGLFKTEAGAIAVRNAIERKYFKEYANKSKNKYKIGLTFGVFDFCHEGHITLLQNARKYVDVLIVCVSNDAYVLQKKNKKPYGRLRDRQRAVYALDCVECVDVQSLTFGKKEAIEKYCPDLLFVGSDHKHDFEGEGLGVPVVYLPRTEGISSSDIIKN